MNRGRFAVVSCIYASYLISVFHEFSLHNLNFQCSIQRVGFNDEFNYFIGKHLYTSYRGFGERVETADPDIMDHLTETIGNNSKLIQESDDCTLSLD